MIFEWTGKYTYLALDLFTLGATLALSFDKKVAFYKQWPYLFPGILVGMLVFIPWDIAFTLQGFWGFNPVYLTGYSLWHLPIEEWLFFIAVPYASVFIYACIEAYFGDPMKRFQSHIWWFWIGISALCLGVGFSAWYPLATFTLLIALLLVHRWFWGTQFMGKLGLMWLVHLLPFFTINGVLTALPIVWYNDNENLGIRLGTVPLEDAFYSLLLLLIVFATMFVLKQKKGLLPLSEK
jgi:lycopene cyclase domain-containing protein